MAVSAVPRSRPAGRTAVAARLKPAALTPIAAAGLLLLLAAFLRLYRLDSLPPGMFIDVASNGLDVRDVLQNLHFPVFFERNYGREALFIYFQAFLVWLAGPRPIVFAFASVAMGMLTVAMSYRLVRSMFGWRLALLTAGLAAFAFWTVAINRFGLRTNSLPPFLVATLYLLWRTLRTGRRSYAVYGGIALGLSLYTYISSRLLPVLVFLVWLAEWRLARQRWRELALMVLVSLAVFAPEGLYFVQHLPEMLLRQSQVSVFNPNPEVEGSHDTPVDSILNTAGMFFVRGDEDVRHDIPHRPVFGPILGAFFALGLVLSAWCAWRDDRYRWPLLWLGVMCLPSALSHESPNSFRILSVAPAAAFFPAAGLQAVAGKLPLRRLAYAVAGLVVLGSGALTAFLYFGPWGHNPAVYWAYDGNLGPLAEATRADASAGEAYFALDHRSTVEFMSPRTETDRWYREESAAIPIPASPNDTVYFSGPKAALAGLAPAMLPGAQPLPHTIAPDGSPDFLAFRWPSPSASELLNARQPLDASIGADFRLAGYELVTVAGKPAIDVFWQPLEAAGPYDLYVHLLDQSGKQVDQADTLAWPVDEGPPRDDLLLTQHQLTVGPGLYTAEIGAVHRSAKDRSQLVGGPIGTARVPLAVS
ncbi:MAG: glycosyltransferase family 39 protein [Chloroflexi bacterium]|nr:glycosyltransferase family 39 protein [Chloroflexota bacterium]